LDSAVEYARRRAAAPMKPFAKIAADAPAQVVVAEKDKHFQPTEEPLSLGSFDDQVTLEIDGLPALTVESYDVHTAVFTQPASFAFVMGHGGRVRELLSLVKPRKPFVLRIGGVLVQTGRIDTIGAGGQSAIVNVAGRDTLQDLADSYTNAERSFTEKTHLAFVNAVLAHGKFDATAMFTTEAVRRSMARGRPALPSSTTVEEKSLGASAIRMRLGDKYFDLIKRVLDRAGLFLYAAPSGRYMITAPNADIAPLYRLVHAPNEGPANVLDFSFRNSTVGRASEYIVYGRGGGKKAPTVKHRGSYVDPEMKDYGYKRVHTFRDWHVQTDAQAELMARRKIAESRRRDWQMSVTVAGHTTTETGTNNRVVWRPDTMVHFDSYQLGLSDTCYIEDVRYRRSASGTTTELRLMRREDLVFGYDEVDT
jgi:prophage tail gpP-like protein